MTSVLHDSDGPREWIVQDQDRRFPLPQLRSQSRDLAKLYRHLFKPFGGLLGRLFSFRYALHQKTISVLVPSEAVLQTPVLSATRALLQRDARQDLYFLLFSSEQLSLTCSRVQQPVHSRRHDESNRSYAPAPAQAAAPSPETESPTRSIAVICSNQLRGCLALSIQSRLQFLHTRARLQLSATDACLLTLSCPISFGL